MVGLASLSGYGQITSPTANVATATQYYFQPHQDSVYVFYNPLQAKIKAAHSSGNAATISWFHLNINTKQFEPVAQSLNSVSSELAIPESGCYSVSVQPTVGNVETDTAWVYLDDFSITGVTPTNTCSSLRLRVNTLPESYEYHVLYYDLSQSSLVPVSKKTI